MLSTPKSYWPLKPNIKTIIFAGIGCAPNAIGSMEGYFELVCFSDIE
jgi:hypothetical protein